MSRRKDVAVFFGGQDANHDLSFETGLWLCQNIPRTKYNVTPVHVGIDGSWQVPQGTLPSRGPINNIAKNLFSGLKKLAAKDGLTRLLARPLDKFVNVIRGKGGDDASLHGAADALGIAMAGSPTSACQIASHKHLCYQAIDDLAQTPFTLAFDNDKNSDEIVEEVRDIMTPPLYVKAAAGEGSSLVEQVNSLEELAASVTRILASGHTVLVQEALQGKELNLTLIGDSAGRVTALPSTIISSRQSAFYDHLAKKHPGRIHMHQHKDNNDSVVAEAETIARDVWQRLNLKGYASFDFIAQPNDLALLEVNLIPASSEHAPFRQQLKSAGISPESFISGYLE